MNANETARRNHLDNPAADCGRVGSRFPTMAAALAYYSDYIGRRPRSNRFGSQTRFDDRVREFVESKITGKEITIGATTPCES